MTPTAAFSDPELVARYAEGPRRLVPGLAALHRMSMLLLAERAPKNARVLVLGAGGGLELKAFADAQPQWTFDGIDPSVEMLALAKQTVGESISRIALHAGYIDDAPTGPFDAGACLLTLHFIPPDERRRTLEEVRRRLRPGAPFVAAHFSIPAAPEERSLWLSRFAAYASDTGFDPAAAEAARNGVGKHLPILSPEEDEAIMANAGWSNITQFYMGFTFRGWVAYA